MSEEKKGKKKKSKTVRKASGGKKLGKEKKTKAEKVKNTPEAKPEKAKKLPRLKHDWEYDEPAKQESKFNIGPMEIKPIKRKKKELKRIASAGGYTAWDGRTGKTFATEKEAKDYAKELLKKHGEIIPVTRTTRNVTHTFKSE